MFGIVIVAITTSNCARSPSSSPEENLVSLVPSPLSANPSLPCAVPDLNLSKIKTLLDAGALVNSTADDCIHMEPSPRGVTLLMRAAGEGRRDVVKLLLDHGADANVSDSYGRTPIFYAASAKDLEIIGLLVDKGADVNAKAESDQTPLMTAAADGDVATINYLIDRGANINARDAHRTTNRV